jgi:lipopolysaccharide export system permease protein
MGSIGLYVFRATLGAFILVLVSLTAIIWVTYVLRDIDLITNQGQTIRVFIVMTSLLIPMLSLIIAPIAFVIAAAYVLTKLAADSEIIVLNAAGMSPWLLFRPFFAAAAIVAAFVALLSAYLSPACLRELRQWSTSVRADVVANIAQPGRFLFVEQGLMFHIRERQSSGILLGILVDDRRTPAEAKTLLAEEGQIVENQHGSILLLKNGSVQRRQPDKSEPTIVNFDGYAIDLSQFAHKASVVLYTARERYAWELMRPDPGDAIYQREAGQFRAELHDRLATPLYPLAFVVIAYAFLGAPRTTRQSRVAAVMSTIIAVGVLRLAGFISLVVGPRMQMAFAIQYFALALALSLGLLAISRGLVIEVPARLVATVCDITDRLLCRFVRA